MNFSGNTFPSKVLLRKMKIKQRKMPFIRGTFKAEILEDDIKRIEDFYYNNGYPDCKISYSTSVENGLMRINISINEGDKIFFGKTEFSGRLIFSMSQLQEKIVYREGEPYSKKKFEQTQNNINRMYSDAGYIKPSIFAIPEVNNSKIDIRFIIDPGERVYINEINIKGNTITKDKVIRREFIIHPGDVYSGSKISKSFNNLADLQFFDEIEITPQPTMDNDLVDINVKVKDRERTGLFAFGGGYSSLENVIGFISIEQRNFDISDPPYFRGAGQDIRLQSEIGGVTKNFMLSFTEPYLFDKPISFGPDIFALTREWDEYTEKHNGVDIRVVKRWDNLSLGFKLLTDNIKLSDIEIPEFQNQKGTNRINSLTTTFSFQNLDRKIMPKSGDMLQLSVEYAGSVLGSDIEYVKTIMENDYYKNLGQLVFHSKTYAGKVDEIDSSQDVPVYERFFGGGIGTVRGYSERELGPRSINRDYYLGGQAIFAQNLELLYPLTKESEILWAIIFYDIGNVWDADFDFGDLKQGAGVGLRIKVPIMPVP
ncbi:MAG TPA: outer membrane protein assembly factor BamA, partial [bacterium]|nr:outer membrane protein assembly factor BamA [bacterium]